MSIVNFPPKKDPLDEMKLAERFGHEVMVDGYVVPNLFIKDCVDKVEIFVGGPVCFIFPREFAPLAIQLAAKAMAVGAGHSHISSEHSSTKSYGPKAMLVELVP